ncbi:translation initiation factor IF-2 [Candidatus Dojkabacteria bacterium]|nr:translation initiation factor IF-2 [Candidatus Dojkabacteria bacterium]
MAEKSRKTKKIKNEKSSRIPIVAVMGHVDHGKTSFLDAVRNTKIQESEEGGITQNTRAHLVEYKGNKITFIDTPGHKAFSAMRSRGAKVTDIVLLVVAADDGVQPQTVESIKFAQEAGVPIVVAINKMDAPGANPDKIKQELSQHNVLVEEFGGDTLISNLSALKKEGLDDVLENILLQAELLELKTKKLDEGVKAEAFVLESNLDENLGPVAMIVIKAGTIKEGDYLATAEGTHKARKVLDEAQKEMQQAGEGEPVWIIGLNNVLETGQIVRVFASQEEAKKAQKEIGKVEHEQKEEVRQASNEDPEENLVEDEDFLAMLIEDEEQKDEIKKLNIVLKADTKGTLEAVKDQLESLNDEEAEVNILKAETGDITGKDIELAKSARAILLGFQVGINEKTETIAKRERVPFRLYKIIYELVDEVDSALASLLDPEIEEVEIARAKIKQVFVLSNKSKIAGCEVIKGIVLKGYASFVERDGKEIGRGKITSLKQNKQEVKEVKKGQDCGILLEPEVDFAEGDDIVCFKIEKY